MKGLGATTMSRLFVIMAQIVQVPLLISSWGASGYGEWLALSAIASYLSYSGLSLSPTIKSEMTVLHAAGDLSALEGLFRGGWLAIWTITLCVGGIFELAIFFLPVLKELHLRHLTSNETTIVVSLIAVQVLMNIINGFNYAIISASGRYGAATLMDTLRQVFEFAAIILVIGVFHKGLPAAASIYALSAVLTLAICTGWTAALFPRIFFGAYLIPIKTIAQLVGPMLGGIGVNLGYNGLLVQAPRIIIASLAGPGAVATYAVSYMLLRIVRIPLEIPSTSAPLELTRAFGRSDREFMKNFLRLVTSISLWIAILVAPLVAVFGPFIVHWWGRGRINPSFFLLSVFSVSTIFYSAGLPSLEGLLCLNKVFPASRLLAILAIPYLLLAVVATKGFGVNGMAVVALIFEMAFSWILIRHMSKLVGVEPEAFIKESFAPPIGPARVELGRARDRWRQFHLRRTQLPS